MRTMSPEPPHDATGIARRQFSTVRKGYDPAEVRAYLHGLADLVGRLQREEAQEHERAERAENRALLAEQLDEHRLVELLGEETARVLDTARKAAGEIRTKAEQSAARMVREAQAEARTIIEQADGDAAARRVEILAEADALRHQAEEEVARRRAEGQVIVDEMRRDAQRQRDELVAEGERARAEAEAAADQIRGSAREQGRHLVGEAQAVRERILNDLSRRRRTAREQLERLNGARERLLAAYEVVRRTVDEATTELTVALPQARAASEMAKQRVSHEPEETVEMLEAELSVARMAGLVDDLAATAVSDEELDTMLQELADEEAALAAPAAEAGDPDDTGDSGGGETGTPAAGVDRDHVAESGSDVGNGPAAAVAPGADAAPVRDAPGRPAPAGGEAPVASGPSGRDAAVAAGAPDREAPVGSGPSGREAAVAGTAGTEAATPSTAGVAPRDEASVGATSGGDAPSSEAASGDVPARGPVPDASRPQTDAERWGVRLPRARRSEGQRADAVRSPGGEAAAAPAPPAPPPPAPPPPPPAAPLRRAAPQSPAPAAPLQPPPPPPTAGPAAAPVARDESETGPYVDELFARIRSEREQGRADATSAPEATPAGGQGAADAVGSGDPALRFAPERPPASEPVIRPGSAPAAASRPRPEPEAESGSEAEDEAEALDPPARLLRHRDELLRSAERELGRKLKRVLADEQNEVLDLLRRQGGAAVDDVVPAASEHADRFAAAAVPVLDAVAARGATLVGGDAEPCGDLAGTLGRSLAEPLRRRIERTFEESDGDLDEATERLRALYREWKANHIGVAVRHFTATAYARGAYEAARRGSPLRWVVDPSCEACPDCDDNALAGKVTKGDTFPTGDTVAPAHPDCRCLVVPSDLLDAG